MSNLVVNGAPVGHVTIQPATGSVATMRRTLDDDGRDQVYFQDNGQLFVATGDNLHLRTYERNVARLDGRPIRFVAADDQVDSARNVAQRVYRRLPSLNNKFVIGGVTAGSMLTAAFVGAGRGGIIRTGVATAGVMLAGSAVLSYARARYPEAFTGILR